MSMPGKKVTGSHAPTDAHLCISATSASRVCLAVAGSHGLTQDWSTGAPDPETFVWIVRMRQEQQKVSRNVPTEQLQIRPHPDPAGTLKKALSMDICIL